jgi:hypothetical protein
MPRPTRTRACWRACARSSARPRVPAAPSSPLKGRNHLEVVSQGAGASSGRSWDPDRLSRPDGLTVAHIPRAHAGAGSVDRSRRAPRPSRPVAQRRLAEATRCPGAGRSAQTRPIDCLRRQTRSADPDGQDGGPRACAVDAQPHGGAVGGPPPRRFHVKQGAGPKPSRCGIEAWAASAPTVTPVSPRTGGPRTPGGPRRDVVATTERGVSEADRAGRVWRNGVSAPTCSSTKTGEHP